MNQSDNCTADIKLKEISESLGKIEGAILGNEYHPTGIIHRVAGLEVRMTRIEGKLSNYTYLFIGIFLSGGGVGAAIAKYLI